MKAGEVTNKASSETGYKAGTGICRHRGRRRYNIGKRNYQGRRININLGTSGWVLCIFNILAKENVFNLSAMPRDSYINVVPFLMRNVHKWISKTLTKDDSSI